MNINYNKILGTGAFSTVYAANDYTIAVKTMKNYAANIQYLHKEIDILSNLNHPNIIKFYNSVYYDNELCMIMEFVQGCDLFEKVCRVKYFTEPIAREIFVQMVSALHYVHQNNVSHRDIKLENFLIDNNNIVKLIDFGLSAKGQIFTQKTGSKTYVAPEILTFYEYNGMIADIWSLGVCLFIMIHGFMPFTFNKYKSWLVFIKQLEREQHIDESITFSKIIRCYPVKCICSEHLIDLFNKMFQVNPKKRYEKYTNIIHHRWFQKN